MNRHCLHVGIQNQTPILNRTAGTSLFVWPTCRSECAPKVFSLLPVHCHLLGLQKKVNPDYIWNCKEAQHKLTTYPANNTMLTFKVHSTLCRGHVITNTSCMQHRMSNACSQKIQQRNYCLILRHKAR